MVDCDVGLARPYPEDTADEPAVGEIRVECQSAVDQRHHGADVLAERGQRISGIRQDARIVAGHFQGSPGEICALPSVRLSIFTPIVDNQPRAAEGGPGERGSGVVTVTVSSREWDTDGSGFMPLRRHVATAPSLRLERTSA